VITQNIDMLHGRAGSRTVVELHGSPANHTCLGCGAGETFAAVAPRVRGGEVPHCPACGGVFKPDITFFGEMLPEGALEAAGELSVAADLMLVLGSSLTVQPAASLPLLTVRSGGSVVIVNQDPTPLDNLALGRIPDLETVFDELEAALDGKGGLSP